MEKNLVKKGQRWKSKTNGKILVITGKATGNRHWATKDEERKNTAHHIHEGTLIKFYELQ